MVVGHKKFGQATGYIRVSALYEICRPATQETWSIISLLLLLLRRNTLLYRRPHLLPTCSLNVCWRLRHFVSWQRISFVRRNGICSLSSKSDFFMISLLLHGFC